MLSVYSYTRKGWSWLNFSFLRPSANTFFLRLVCWNGLIDVNSCLKKPSTHLPPTHSHPHTHLTSHMHTFLTLFHARVDVLVLTCISHLFVSRSALIYCFISFFLRELVWLLVTDERQENRIMTGNRSVLFSSVANFLCPKDIFSLPKTICIHLRNLSWSSSESLLINILRANAFCKKKSMNCVDVLLV